LTLSAYSQLSTIVFVFSSLLPATFCFAFRCYRVLVQGSLVLRLAAPRDEDDGRQEDLRTVRRPVVIDCSPDALDARPPLLPAPMNNNNKV
jgi:hypothetical protein